MDYTMSDGVIKSISCKNIKKYMTLISVLIFLEKSILYAEITLSPKSLFQNSALNKLQQSLIFVINITDAD